jgi:hypothetical protein
MLNAERSFRRINGYKQMRQLVAAFHRHAHPETNADTEKFGVVAYSSSWIVAETPRDSRHAQGGARHAAAARLFGSVLGRLPRPSPRPRDQFVSDLGGDGVDGPRLWTLWNQRLILCGG